MKWSYDTQAHISKCWDKTYIVCRHPRNKNKCPMLLQVLAWKVQVRVMSKILKFHKTKHRSWEWVQELEFVLIFTFLKGSGWPRPFHVLKKLTNEFLFWLAQFFLLFSRLIIESFTPPTPKLSQRLKIKIFQNQWSNCIVLLGQKWLFWSI